MARILVVDDESVIRKLLNKALTRAGHRVDIATDGVEGLAAFDATPPDLVITDLIMPEKEGIEFITSMRKRDAATPIIAISGGGRLGTTDYLHVAQALGATAILPKPFNVAELLSLVNSVLDGARQSPSP